MWEDYSLFAGNLGYSAAMLPTILRGRLPSWGTCMLIAAMECGFLAAYVSLRLPFAAAGCSVSLVLWAWLSWRTYGK